jgi:hypothetical protein
VVLRVVAGLAVAIAAVAVAVASCGLSMLPFVGTVLLLPAFVFLRLSSMEFLALSADDLRGLGSEGAAGGLLLHS